MASVVIAPKSMLDTLGSPSRLGGGLLPRVLGRRPLCSPPYERGGWSGSTGPVRTGAGVMVLALELAAIPNLVLPLAMTLLGEGLVKVPLT